MTLAGGTQRASFTVHLHSDSERMSRCRALRSQRTSPAARQPQREISRAEWNGNCLWCRQFGMADPPPSRLGTNAERNSRAWGVPREVRRAKIKKVTNPAPAESICQSRAGRIEQGHPDRSRPAKRRAKNGRIETATADVGTAGGAKARRRHFCLRLGRVGTSLEGHTEPETELPRLALCPLVRRWTGLCRSSSC